jgi:RNA polymerase subunit RPABC4/transcription elongation factor Spt4
MSRLREELRVIPRTAWAIGIVFYLMGSTLICFVAFPRDPEASRLPLAVQIAFAYGFFLVLFAWVLLIGYVYADARRRGMRYVLWTWLAILVPNAIGILLYFVLRDPLPKTCPQCAALVGANHVFCPSCGTPMQPTCPSCGRGVEPGWSNCPHCGAKLPSPAARTA